MHFITRILWELCMHYKEILILLFFLYTSPMPDEAPVMTTTFPRTFSSNTDRKAREKRLRRVRRGQRKKSVERPKTGTTRFKNNWNKSMAYGPKNSKRWLFSQEICAWIKQNSKLSCNILVLCVWVINHTHLLIDFVLCVARYLYVYILCVCVCVNNSM